jgi:hypothetical protein
MSKNIAHTETFSEIFEGFEFKRPFKKPQAVENFWLQFTPFPIGLSTGHPKGCMIQGSSQV